MVTSSWCQIELSYSRLLKAIFEQRPLSYYDVLCLGTEQRPLSYYDVLCLGTELPSSLLVLYLVYITMMYKVENICN